MKKIAITGVIASGKSVVCKIIENLGGFVIYTDKINNELLLEHDYIKKFAEIFPNAVIAGKVDKVAIRKEILSNDKKRLALNSLAHKEISNKVKGIIDKFDGKMIFCEIPLILESGMVDYFDEIWCVTANNSTKIKRIMARDNVTEEQAKGIIALQKSDDELIAISDIIIQNDGSVSELEEKIKSLFGNICL